MKPVLIVVAILLIISLGILAFAIRPRNDRRWSVGQAVLPFTEFSGRRVTIHNVRNFRYAPDGTPSEQRYETRPYDVGQLTSVWLVVAPFSPRHRGPAHTFLSFGFADSSYVSISIEARREVGEDYSVLGGLLRRFEILYVVGDERDLIGYRANNRRYDVYVYPIRTSSERARSVFVQMLERANALRSRPEFYNTLTNNCTTNLLRHANRVAPKKIPYGRAVLLPGYVDELAGQLGLIDSNLTLAQARLRFHVNERARKYADDPQFSVKIREES